MTHLNNPPIVEVWLALVVEPSPDSQPWNFGTAQAFSERLQNDWDEAEIQHSREVQVRDMERGLPQVVGERQNIDRVRLFDKDRTKCIQYTRTQIIYNSLRSGSDYPGYEQVYNSAAAAFRSYLEFFRPTAIREAIISYIDIVNLPVRDCGTVELSDYFKMGVDLKEEVFGPMCSYEFRSTFNCKVDAGPLVLSLRSLPGNPDQRHVRIWMEWQKNCVELDTLDFAVVRARLDTSKQHLSNCFKESFTESGWNLFEPENRIS